MAGRSVEIPISKLADTVVNELTAYSKDVAKIADECVEDVANQCVEKLKSTSPRKTGKYADAWKAETVFNKSGNKRVVVRNKKYYYLTHLLEYGHALKNGKGRAKAIPHIKPVENFAQKELQKQIEEKVKKV